MINSKLFKLSAGVTVVMMVFSFSFFAVSNLVLAAGASGDWGTPNTDTPNIDTIDKNITRIDNPLQGEGEFRWQYLIGRMARALIAPIGAVAFLFFVVGGFFWIFSAGNEEKVKRGKDIMVWALVGLVLVFSSYALLTFILKILGVVE